MATSCAALFFFLTAQGRICSKLFTLCWGACPFKLPSLLTPRGSPWPTLGPGKCRKEAGQFATNICEGPFGSFGPGVCLPKPLHFHRGKGGGVNGHRLLANNHVGDSVGGRRCLEARSPLGVRSATRRSKSTCCTSRRPAARCSDAGGRAPREISA